MLRSVLPIGNVVTGGINPETNDKLLELVDSNTNDESRASTEQEVDESQQQQRGREAFASVVTQAAPSPASDSSSPVTQVPTRSRAFTQPSQPFVNDGKVRGNSWRSKFKNILCCLTPLTAERYVRHVESNGSAARPIPPPFLPPTWSTPAIGPPAPEDIGKRLLVLDLDETLVHSSFKPVPSPDYIIPVDIEGRIVDVYVLKRPYVDHFLRVVGQKFEVVVFTASLGKYADPLLDLLDRSGVIRWRLFRESCYAYEGSYVKDLRAMGRDMADVVIVDNSPHSYAFQPENAVPIGTFIDDMEDQELLECLDILLAIEKAEDVREALVDIFAGRLPFSDDQAFADSGD